MIEIFKTDVENEEQAKILLALLYVKIHPAEINFDLEDCDNILRIKGEDFCCLDNLGGRSLEIKYILFVFLNLKIL
jgi:hypothetical protein